MFTEILDHSTVTASVQTYSWEVWCTQIASWGHSTASLLCCVEIWPLSWLLQMVDCLSLKSFCSQCKLLMLWPLVIPLQMFSFTPFANNSLNCLCTVDATWLYSSQQHDGLSCSATWGRTEISVESLNAFTIFCFLTVWCFCHDVWHKLVSHSQSLLTKAEPLLDAPCIIIIMIHSHSTD